MTQNRYSTDIVLVRQGETLVGIVEIRAWDDGLIESCKFGVKNGSVVFCFHLRSMISTKSDAAFVVILQ